MRKANGQFGDSIKSMKKCKNCGELFTPKRRDQKYCCKKCLQRYNYRERNPLHLISCEFCNDIFMPDSHRVIYCSEKCAKEADREKSIERFHQNKKDFPERYHYDLGNGSKDTISSGKLIRDKDGNPDFDRELEVIRNQKKKLGL